MKLKVELLPCPFCGSDKVLLCQWRDTENPNATWIGCENCGISQDSFHHEDAEHVKGIATMMWNTRMPNPTQLTAERDKYRDAVERLRVMFAVATPITSHGHGDNYGGLGIQQISGYTPPVRFNPIFCTEKSALEWMQANSIRGQIVELQIYDDFARQVKAELEAE